MSFLDDLARSRPGPALETALSTIGADTIAKLLFTSGSTGLPKGAMISHRNVLFQLGSNQALIALKPGDNQLCFLPLCHSFERTAGHNFMLHSGVTIAYAESVEALAANMQEVRPTIVCCVPRLFEKLHARVMAGIDAKGGALAAYTRWALDAAIAAPATNGFSKPNAASGNPITL